jgi:hypothetical protein
MSCPNERQLRRKVQQHAHSPLRRRDARKERVPKGPLFLLCFAMSGCNFFVYGLVIFFLFRLIWIVTPSSFVPMTFSFFFTRICVDLAAV